MFASIALRVKQDPPETSGMPKRPPQPTKSKLAVPLGRVIRSLRERTGSHGSRPLSQLYIAGEAGYADGSTMSRIEKGAWSPPIAYLEVIAAQLGRRPSDLLRMAEEDSGGETLPQRIPREISEELAWCMQHFPDYSPEIQRIAMEAAREAINKATSGVNDKKAPSNAESTPPIPEVEAR